MDLWSNLIVINSWQMASLMLSNLAWEELMGSLHSFKEVLNRLRMYGNGYSMAIVLDHRSTATSLTGNQTVHPDADGVYYWQILWIQIQWFETKDTNKGRWVCFNVKLLRIKQVTVFPHHAWYLLDRAPVKNIRGYPQWHTILVDSSCKPCNDKHDI